MDLFRQTLKPVEQVLKDADEVVLVGGSTRIPKDRRWCLHKNEPRNIVIPTRKGQM